jgi:hypothetical protein
VVHEQAKLQPIKQKLEVVNGAEGGQKPEAPDQTWNSGLHQKKGNWLPARVVYLLED